MIAGMHQRQAKALDERRVDIGDEIAEVIDADDDTGDGAGIDGRLVDPGRHECAHTLSPEVRRKAETSGSKLGGHRREDVPAVERGARPMYPDVRKNRSRHAHDVRTARPAHHRRQQAVIGSEKIMPAGWSTAMMSREVPTPGSTTATCTVPRGK